MIEKTVNDLAQIEGISGCYAVDREGEVIVFVGESNIDEKIIAARAAEIVKEIAVQMRIPEKFTIIADTSKSKLFITTKKDFILVIISEPEVDTGKMRIRLQAAVKSLVDSL